MRRHIVFFGILLLYGNFLPGYPQVTAASTETSDLLIASGDSLMLFENFSGAQKEFIKALELAESIKDERKALAILNRLGRSAIELNDSTKARRYLRHAKRIAGQYPNAAPERAGTLATWGLYYNQFGPDSLAASYFERSLDILQTCCAEEHGMLGSVCLDYAKFWSRIKNPSAEEMAIRSTEYLRQVSGVSRIKLADAYNLCGSMVRERGETELRNHYVNGAAQILSVFPKAPPNLAIQIYANLAAQKVDADQFQDAVIIYRNIKN
ncbi:MAG: tetratricopeptide repeat protein, partial [Saprospiraceae bacterium]|nr:tetratricopeptide repeat protein [Saprospiraceae bacterium]